MYLFTYKSGSTLAARRLASPEHRSRRRLSAPGLLCLPRSRASCHPSSLAFFASIFAIILSSMTFCCFLRYRLLALFLPFIFVSLRSFLVVSFWLPFQLSSRPLGVLSAPLSVRLSVARWRSDRDSESFSAGSLSNNFAISISLRWFLVSNGLATNVS